jgi:hypothetical protein
MQNISKPKLHHSKMGREDGMGKGDAGSHMCYHLAVFPALPISQHVNVRLWLTFSLGGHADTAPYKSVLYLVFSKCPQHQAHVMQGLGG